NDVVNDGNLPVTILTHKAVSSGRLRGIIDQMLAHVTRNQVEAAYNRAEYRERKRELAQEWADMLLEGFAPAVSLLNRPRR
ncbi:hypothetical protein ACJRO0_13795, partial [Acetobacter oryzifermentans]